jgi:hypothetical protein
LGRINVGFILCFEIPEFRIACSSYESVGQATESTCEFSDVTPLFALSDVDVVDSSPSTSSTGRLQDMGREKGGQDVDPYSAPSPLFMPLSRAYLRPNLDNSAPQTRDRYWTRNMSLSLCAPRNLNFYVLETDLDGKMGILKSVSFISQDQLHSAGSSDEPTKCPAAPSTVTANCIF